MAIGLREDGARRPLNLTQLRKNKRKRPDKTSGRKRPRTDDVDVIPAGDINDDELQQLQSAVAATAARLSRLTLTLLLLQTLVVQNVAWRNRRQTFVLKTLDGLIATCAITGTTSAAQPLEKL